MAHTPRPLSPLIHKNGRAFRRVDVGKRVGRMGLRDVGASGRGGSTTRTILRDKKSQEAARGILSRAHQAGVLSDVTEKDVFGQKEVVQFRRRRLSNAAGEGGASNQRVLAPDSFVTGVTGPKRTTGRFFTGGRAAPQDDATRRAFEAVFGASVTQRGRGRKETRKALQSVFGEGLAKRPSKTAKAVRIAAGALPALTIGAGAVLGGIAKGVATGGAVVGGPNTIAPGVSAAAGGVSQSASQGFALGASSGVTSGLAKGAKLAIRGANILSSVAKRRAPKRKTTKRVSSSTSTRSNRRSALNPVSRTQGQGNITGRDGTGRVGIRVPK